ncbi:hypothetical protein [Amycolatopsis sp. NPDC051371]|uniref:hypothetical protein n=1 Tax=Amycolatopsis sp. NPDC051371 TaxID=3155800 RepID=UPI00343A96BA
MTLDFTAPGRAAPRGDLTFLRRRRRAAAPVVSDAPLDLDAEPVVVGGASLDLDAAPAQVSRESGAFDGVSLDLDVAPASLSRESAGLRGASLDFALRSALPDTRPALPARRAGRPGRPVVRLGAGRRLQLGPKTPAVTLDRLQSAIGLLTAEAVSGAAALGCAYELADGRSAYLGSGTTASRTPFLAVRRRSVSADLRQVRQLVRLVVIAVFPPGEAPPGLLIVSTWDGCRLELPLGKSGRVTVPLSVHNVDGELVLRAEAAEALTSPRAAVEAFGFPRISWLDDFTCAGGVA